MQNFMISEDPLSLDRIRSTLVRLEDTIIFSLIERAQFAHNPKIYERGGMKELIEIGFEGSWLEWFLKETETFHGACRFGNSLGATVSLNAIHFFAIAKARRYTRYECKCLQLIREMIQALLALMNTHSRQTCLLLSCRHSSTHPCYTQTTSTSTPPSAHYISDRSSLELRDKPPLLSRRKSALWACRATRNSRMMAIMAAQPRSTSRFSKPSANACISVRGHNLISFYLSSQASSSFQLSFAFKLLTNVAMHSVRQIRLRVEIPIRSSCFRPPHPESKS